MDAQLGMLLDLFTRDRSSDTRLLIKTHPQQLSAVRDFIESYTRSHLLVDIESKGAVHLARGEYEVHILPQRAVDAAEARHQRIARKAA